MGNLKKLLESDRILIMGILNVTPDSFYDGGRYYTAKKALRHAEKLAEEGADIIDIGGESTRPGSEPLPENEELRRVAPIIKEIGHITGWRIPVSIDTYKSGVARQAIEMGAEMVNDISGLGADPEMAPLLAKTGVPVVIMHMKGTPKLMQKNPRYKDVVAEVIEFFRDRTTLARSVGIDAEKIILDPGIGFGKTTAHNLAILKNFKKFGELGYKTAVGVSRKSFIGKILGSESSPAPLSERLEGSIAAAVLAAASGAKILRVHDVRETKRAIKVAEAILSAR
jgi:dihydropteroate synthase